jgi:cytochrome bd ubiquinol oxidase subunit I
MESLDPVLLARIQFAANITFHILFPTISISMGWFLLFFKSRFVATGQQHWMDAYQFWIKMFALTFVLGVVSGITMSFQFGTNWPGFMNAVGNVAGPLLAYEVLTAFFLEATMLGIMLFGRGRVSERTHTIATLLVAIGTTMSAFWILALNSWMHTPAGFEMIDGQAHVTSWFEVIFNPSFPYRFSHMMIASALTGSFFLAGISAYRWLQGDRGRDVMATLSTGVFVAATLIPVQLFAWPDAKTQSNLYEIAIPHLASLYLTHSWSGEVKGIKDFGDKHPPVAPIFWAFRVMVGVGVLMMAVSWWTAFQLRRKKDLSDLNARVLVAMSFAGWVALVAGWYVTEIGRQPWIVYGVLTTAQAASKVPASNIAITLVMYLTMYAALLASYVSVVFYLARKAGSHQTDEHAGSPQPPGLGMGQQSAGLRNA